MKNGCHEEQDYPVIWCGEPLAEMSHARLLDIVADLWRENERLRQELAYAGAMQIADAAAIGRERLRPWWSGIFLSRPRGKAG